MWRYADMETVEDYLRELLEEIDTRGQDLTDWEIGFVAKFIDEEPDFFTRNEGDKIQQIYMERVS